MEVNRLFGYSAKEVLRYTVFLSNSNHVTTLVKYIQSRDVTSLL